MSICRRLFYAKRVLFDAFVCHASEDKEGFVRPLVDRLRNEHVEIWYDEFSLEIGDSLRRSIDRGLGQSRFGIIVLSPHFFQKKWSQWELDGLVARQNDTVANVILPVWHGVGRDDVIAYSPSLADKLAASSAEGIDEVARRLLRVIRPHGSTLVIARNHLLGWGYKPPVISDDWWLDVAASAESNDMEGDFQEAMGWGRWGFPLPPSSNAPSGRGLRMAQAAAQMDWQREAEAQPITQITHPKDVHDFIQSHPVLADTCHIYPRYLIAYAPQLTVRGYGGPFEEVIEAMYRRSVTQSERKRAANDPAGSGLTADGRHPGCDDEFVLRDPEFGMYGPAHIACGFVQGNSVASGPPVQYYAYIEYLAWMLSEASCWLPAPVRERLTLGMAEWPVWAWTEYEGRLIEEFGFEDQPFTGKFGAWLNKARLGDVPSLGSAAAMDVNHRMQFSSTLLKLPEDGATLAERFLAPEFLGVHLLARSRRGRQRLS